jgi:outer membrane protein OmpA-like peptidoglycan-associated protein
MPHPGWRLLIAALVSVVAVGSAVAQDFGPDDPIPAGAKGKVLQLSGAVLPLSAKVLPLEGKILEIKGLGAGLAGAVSPVEATLEELGATVEEKQIKIDLAADVLFDFDKAALRPEAGPALEKVGEVLAAYPRAIVLIEGHTDAKGSDAYNQKLSERRAQSVLDWLAGNGVANQMTARGLGEKAPAAPNEKPDGADDPEGRQKNRRVQITVNTE